MQRAAFPLTTASTCCLTHYKPRIGCSFSRGDAARLRKLCVAGRKKLPAYEIGNEPWFPRELLQQQQPIAGLNITFSYGVLQKLCYVLRILTFF
jgi:hypothetical protein